MIRNALLAAVLVLPIPAVASEWMGSVDFTKNAFDNTTTATWKASLKNGEGKGKLSTGQKFDVQKSNSFFIISQNGGVVGTGMVVNGHVAGTFQIGNAFAGNFQGDRTSGGSDAKRGEGGGKKGRN